MSATELTSTDDRMAGITDAAWWRWFNAEISGSDDPWRDWLDQLRFPRAGPLQAGLENDIESAIRSADALRLATVAHTTTFGKQWATFRQHHQELDCGGKYRRLRTMVWRAAALKAICERNLFQDDVDAQQAGNVLAQTMLFFCPSIDGNGDFPGGNFWRVGDRDRPDAMAEYAAMVLLLLRRALASAPP